MQQFGQLKSNPLKKIRKVNVNCTHQPGARRRFYDYQTFFYSCWRQFDDNFYFKRLTHTFLNQSRLLLFFITSNTAIHAMQKIVLLECQNLLKQLCSEKTTNTIFIKIWKLLKHLLLTVSLIHALKVTELLPPVITPSLFPLQN